jgi:hypothetical protein
MLGVSGMRIGAVRIVGLAGFGVLTMAAAPSSFSLASGPVFTEATIVANTPAAEAVAPGTSVYAPAPMPDLDQGAPSLRELGPPRPELSPNLVVGQKSYRGDGFMPGSTVQGTEERNSHPAPGFALKVPLE